MARILNISLISIFFVVTLFSLGMSQNETLSITTYYPSPVGTYRTLRWGTNLATSRGTLLPDQGSSIDLGGSGQPYINFSNDMAALPAFDARIILIGDDSLNIEGADVNIGTVLSFSNDFATGPDATIILRSDNELAIVDANVTIGTALQPAQLIVIGGMSVQGNINLAGDLVTDTTVYPDYVFEPGYRLMPLRELNNFITGKRHLPNMPSAEEVKKEGVKLFEQNRLTLEKLEEAYLYIIELENRVAKLEAKLGLATKK